MKRFVQYSIITLLVSLLTAAAVWANKQQGALKCTDVKINIINEDTIAFVTKTGILRDLKEAGVFPVGLSMSAININAIEKHLSESEFLENVECYFDNTHALVIEASQMVPVMRVFDGNSSYYVNRNGKRISAQGRYFVDVPVVEGHFPRAAKFQPTALLPIMDYVASDDALSSLVSMYVVRDSCNICFVPSVCGHIVNLGSVDGYRSKFAKLMQFYRQVMPVKGWNTYSEISLKWDYQVVATLRSKSLAAEEVYDPDADEQAPDMASIQLDDIKREVVTGKKVETRAIDDATDAKPDAKVEAKSTAKTDAKKPAEEKKAKSPADKVKDKFSKTDKTSKRQKTN